MDKYSQYETPYISMVNIRGITFALISCRWCQRFAWYLQSGKKNVNKQVEVSHLLNQNKNSFH